MKLAQAQRKAEALAREDALTGLPNRRIFASELDATFQRHATGGGTVAVMLVDLDRFKPVNDLHGHAAGDVVLREIASRLRCLMEPGAVLARLGGDEFAIIAAPMANQPLASAHAIHLAGRIIARLSDGIAIGPTPVAVGASVGIAFMSDDVSSPEQVMHAADVAMYRAKQDGRNTFRIYDVSMDEEIRAKADFERDLRVALESGVIKPNYQPIIDLMTGSIAGFEVLARWFCPDRGSVPPDAFISHLERMNLLGQLTESILRQACRDARNWSEDVRLAINVSPVQLQDQALPTMVASILKAERFPPRRLEVEMTETALTGDLNAVRSTLDTLRSLGVGAVLDDFGTGYSSLSHLRAFRFDKIKIDRSFVQAMRDDKQSQIIVNAVLKLTRALGLPAVAEGVEDAETMAILSRHSCAFGQGFLFSQAVSADVATMMLKQHNLLAPGLARFTPSAVAGGWMSADRGATAPA